MRVTQKRVMIIHTFKQKLIGKDEINRIAIVCVRIKLS